MLQQLFTVYDEKAAAYLPPFFLPRNAQAERVFGDCINSGEHQFSKHPQDYTLFHLGTFDDCSSEFVLITAKSLGNGLEFIRPDTPPSEPIHEIRDDAQPIPGTPSGNSA